MSEKSNLEYIFPVYSAHKFRVTQIITGRDIREKMGLMTTWELRYSTRPTNIVIGQSY